MTFKELFEAAMSKVDMTKEYKGRYEAINAFINELRILIKPLIDKSKWETVWAAKPYGNDDPCISLAAHGVNSNIDFRVKLKKNGSHYRYGIGKVTMYLPSVAFTVNEDLMIRDVVEVFDEMYNTNPKVAKKIEEEEYRAELIEKHRDLLTRYTLATNEFNALPEEERAQLRYAGLPRLEFY